jgi:hypothetical protein
LTSNERWLFDGQLFHVRRRNLWRDELAAPGSGLQRRGADNRHDAIENATVVLAGGSDDIDGYSFEVSRCHSISWSLKRGK